MFDPQRLISALHQHRVRYVIVGGIAAEIHGTEQKTGDFNVCDDRAADNLTALVAALSPQLGAPIPCVFAVYYYLEAEDSKCRVKESPLLRAT